MNGSDRHRYECSKGHAVSVPGNMARPSRCPVYVHGHACPAPLTLLGPTSKRVSELFGVGARAHV